MEVDVSTFAPEELHTRETLRDHLRVGRFMGLVPLLHLLRDVCGLDDWGERPLRASFVIDDPNLHWLSYGYLRYPELVERATRRYHVGLAMVPLDGRVVSGRAASLVRDNPLALSVLMHGNDHVAHELGRITNDAEARSVLAQALARTARFERCHRVPVSRVMAPPHEVCSMAALRAMFALAYDGACIGRRFPWLDREPQATVWPLAKWHPADTFDDFVPILPRYPIDEPWEDLVFRALLGQPLILFGHHWDFAEGIELLDAAATYVNGLGDVRWGCLGAITRDGFRSTRDGDVGMITLHSARVDVPIPKGVSKIVVAVPRSGEGAHAPRVYVGEIATQTTADGGVWRSGPVNVAAGTCQQVRLRPGRSMEPVAPDRPRTRVWPIVRRVLAESRDRTQPLVGRVSRRGGAQDQAASSSRITFGPPTQR